MHADAPTQEAVAVFVREPVSNVTGAEKPAALDADVHANATSSDGTEAEPTVEGVDATEPDQDGDEPVALPDGADMEGPGPLAAAAATCEESVAKPTGERDGTDATAAALAPAENGPRAKPAPTETSTAHGRVAAPQMQAPETGHYASQDLLALLFVALCVYAIVVLGLSLSP